MVQIITFLYFSSWRQKGERKHAEMHTCEGSGALHMSATIQERDNLHTELYALQNAATDISSDFLSTLFEKDSQTLSQESEVHNALPSDISYPQHY